MKTIIAVITIVATVTSASAMSAVSTEVSSYIGAEKAAKLTEAQLRATLLAIRSSDSEGEKRAFLRSLTK